jgi:archaeosine synthase
MIPPDAALYAPAMATPANLAFLIYLGIDLVDSVKVEADGYMGLYHTADGCWPLERLDPLPCLCEHCLAMPAGSVPELAAAHNLLKLEEALLMARQMIRSGTLREHIEKQVRVSPGLTAALRLLDGEHSYLEARTPLFRHSVLYANSAESLKRVEVTRFAERVLKRYRAPESDVLLLLPCSARKPYSTSRSHQIFLRAIGPARRYLHQLILTSPLALVPRELEEVYPAASYDLPVTGHWDLEERHWLLGCLETYLEKNRYARIVAHLEGELEDAVLSSGLDAVYTGGGTQEEDGKRLSSAVQEACQGSRRMEDLRLQRFRAAGDYYFGSGAGDILLSGAVRYSGRELQDGEKRALAMLTANGTIALSLAGARRLEHLGSYIVTMGDFVPRGSLLAPGVIDADEQIRPGDEVIVRGEKAFGVGRARMSGWEMVRSKRGVAVELRSVSQA